MIVIKTHGNLLGKGLKAAHEGKASGYMDFTVPDHLRVLSNDVVAEKNGERLIVGKNDR